MIDWKGIDWRLHARTTWWLLTHGEPMHLASPPNATTELRAACIAFAMSVAGACLAFLFLLHELGSHFLPPTDPIPDRPGSSMVQFLAVAVDSAKAATDGQLDAWAVSFGLVVISALACGLSVLVVARLLARRAKDQQQGPDSAFLWAGTSALAWCAAASFLTTLGFAAYRWLFAGKSLGWSGAYVFNALVISLGIMLFGRALWSASRVADGSKEAKSAAFWVGICAAIVGLIVPLLGVTIPWRVGAYYQPTLHVRLLSQCQLSEHQCVAALTLRNARTFELTDSFDFFLQVLKEGQLGDESIRLKGRWAPVTGESIEPVWLAKEQVRYVRVTLEPSTMVGKPGRCPSWISSGRAQPPLIKSTRLHVMGSFLARDGRADLKPIGVELDPFINGYWSQLAVKGC